MYDNLCHVSYQFDSINFATGSTGKMRVPRGATFARVCDILCTASVTFTQVTTPGQVQIGDGTTANAFAALTMGALASGNSLGAGDPTGGIWVANYLAANYNSGAGLHDLIVTFVAPTGGTPAGTATITIVVGYDQIQR